MKNKLKKRTDLGNLLKKAMEGKINQDLKK